MRGMTPTASTAVRAEALFASPLQESTAAGPAEVRAAVATALLRHGAMGCAVIVASEYGDHPDLAAHRMRWAVTTIQTAYADYRRPPTPRARVARPRRHRAVNALR